MWIKALPRTLRALPCTPGGCSASDLLSWPGVGVVALPGLPWWLCPGCHGDIAQAGTVALPRLTWWHYLGCHGGIAQAGMLALPRLT